MSITLSPHQEDCLKTVLSKLKGIENPQPIVRVDGYAGTGKSTLLPFILEALGYPPDSVAFCGPTGKSAKVMRTKLKAQGYPNFRTSTIHSAIYRAKPAPVATLERDLADHREQLQEYVNRLEQQSGAPLPPVKLKLDHEYAKQTKLIQRLQSELDQAYDEDKISFQLNPDAPIQLAQLIVVDEASMVGRRMTDDLLSFGVPILAFGDPGQLPPVQDDEGLTAGEPDFLLSEIHRQALDNPIIYLSQLARQGKDLPYGDYGDGVVVMDRQNYDYGGTFEQRPMFICGMNKTRWRITQMLRADFGFIQDPRQVLGPRTTEPVVVKKNTRDYPNLVNGTECIAQSDFELRHGHPTGKFSFEDDELTPYRDKTVFQGKFEEHYTRKQGAYSAPKSLTYRAMKSSIVMDWSYVITGHTAQGSQFDDVVVIDESSVFREEANRHLYTTLTRAAKTLKVLR